MNSPYRIALLVLYFGPLPPYFPVWLQSAQANSDVDFLFYTDQEVQIDAPNFRVARLTLAELQARFSKTLRRALFIPNGYKLCDYRPAFGLLFEEELRGYDFWGHCDIDLVFGHIRHFLTDEILSRYDRFYAYGPLSVYRNSEKMNHAFELPGNWFTLDEMFGPLHVGADEFAGINRICVKNRISWYVEPDLAGVLIKMPPPVRLNVGHGCRNYPVQTFYYLNGRAFHRYLDGNVIKEDEVLYIHPLKMPFLPERPPRAGEAVVIASDALRICPPEVLTPENIRLWNPSESAWHAILYEIQIRIPGYLSFLTGNLAFKKVWLKRKAFHILEVRLKKLPYP